MAAIFLTGCHDGEPYRNDIITGPYRWDATNFEEQRCISYAVNDDLLVVRIPETVFGVGWNKRYIVAKQHPGNQRDVINYFYIDISRDGPYADEAQSVTGPLTEAEFNHIQKEIGLPPITRIIKSLE